MSDTVINLVTQDHPLAHLIPELRIADRCCRCGAQAFYAFLWAVANTEPVLLCGHHAAAHHDVIKYAALAIRDERQRINTEASTSANV